ncbi:MAG: hypothetical protein IJW70_03770 [Clostridia bacterium]|nr:hypothetical protein [Clostridia bacterium]
MKRYVNRLLCLLLALLLCASMTSCAWFEGVKDWFVEDEAAYEFDYEGTLTPGGDVFIRKQYKDVVYWGEGVPMFEYTEQDAAELMKQLDELYECLEQEDAAAFVAMFTYVQYGAFARMESQCSLAQLEYSLFRDDPEAAENYEWMRAFATDASDRLFKLYRLVYDSPHKETFFRGWSDEDIRMVLLYADAVDEEYTALLEEYDDLIVSYYELQQSEDFIYKSAAMYPDAVRINNAVAQKLGYDNYMDYAYEFIYMRDYTPEDVEVVRAYVKEYLVPLYREVSSKLSVLGAELRQSEIDEIDAMMYQEYNSQSVQDYMQMMDGRFLEEYTVMMEEQNYCFSYDPYASRDGAFTDCLREEGQPFIYMGASYADAFTLIHEYGHYYAFSVDPMRNASYDLSELQSQGNEWLYLAYLSEQNNSIASLYTSLYRLYNDIGMVILCLSVDEFEQTVYANPDAYSDPSLLDDLFTNIIGSYIDPAVFGLSISEYWHYVAFDAAGYYVSYAVSLIPCFELYFMAETDLEKAVQTYLSLSEYEGNKTYFEVLDLAGLQNPLDEDYVPVDYEELYELMQQKQ